MIATLRSTTEARVNLLDISGSTPTSLQTSTHGKSWGFEAPALAKVSPWTYVVAMGSSSIDDYILRLTPMTSRIGMTEFNVSSSALEDITLRFQLANTT